MAFLENFGGDYELAMQSIVERYNTIDRRVDELTPVDIEAAAELDEDEEKRIKLEWVTVKDPRNQTEDPFELEVQISLRCGWVDDGSGFGSMEGVVALEIFAKLPSGAEQIIGSMGLNEDTEDSCLFLHPEAGTLVFARWDSADAELFLTLTESALAAL